MRALRWRDRWRSLLPGRDDLLADSTYRRLWMSTLISSLGGQITMLAIPLTAAVLLNASPLQMGWLTAMEIVPFGLFALPAGVWLDRARKLPVYVGGELLMAAVVGSVPVAWWLGHLTMTWLYVVAFGIGFLYATAGSAAQIVLTQIVERDRLVEAHAKNALASSAAEVAGPGVAGALIRILGAPFALIADVILLTLSAVILRGLDVREGERAQRQAFWPAMRGGIGFVRSNRLLVAMATIVGVFQVCYQGALVVQILFATRVLGLSEHQVGLCYVALGVGTIGASAVGNRVAMRLGPGPTLLLGIAICGVGWLVLAMAPAGPAGVLAFVFMLWAFGVGAVLLFINFLALRQAVTPAPLLGRMTTTMRWFGMIPGIPGAICGGWIGEHYSLQATLACSGVIALVTAALSNRLSVLRELKTLPALDRETSGPVGSIIPPIGTD